MASFTFNIGAEKLNGGVASPVDFLADTIKIALVTAMPNKDDDNLSGITELNVSGYNPGFAGSGRKTLGSKTLARDDANDRVKFDAADPAAWTALAAGATIVGAIIYKHITDDATSVPLFFLDCADTPTNGGDFTLQFHADGIGYTQQ